MSAGAGGSALLAVRSARKRKSAAGQPWSRENEPHREAPHDETDRQDRRGAHHRRRHARREHWTAAAAGARSVANAIVGVESPDHSESFFWSDAFGWRLQMVGEAGGHLRAEVCDDADDGFLVRYLDGRGDMRGGLAVNRPEALAPLRRQLGAPRRAVSVSPVMEA